MNAELEERWKEGQSPFDGQILRSPPLTLDGVQAGLVVVVNILAPPGKPTFPLHTLLDWHQHDGYLIQDSMSDSEELRAAVASEQSVVQWSSDDTNVWRAWYPSDFSFLLRWCISSDPTDFGVPGAPADGSFDLTGTDDIVRQVRELVPDAELRGAKEFFDQTYAG